MAKFTDEDEAAYRARIDQGDYLAARYLGNVLLTHGRLGEAEAALLRTLSDGIAAADQAPRD